ncbi:MAG: hypothetical protein K9N47_24385 [Prosthecobacter sp.]|uniref:hypothetical protein n=1 Tax=Prosthecobacter sp. TaxID=1965333 RepID=UPI00261DB78A|nr:hypothetical protein [Prosthecobacter sp.]MCF7789282.1 hypothetical protein [Prosthecobacter sp.]
MNAPPPLPATTDDWSEDDVSAYLNQPLLDKGRPMAGTEGMSIQQIEDDVLRGGRFRIFRYNFSVIVMSFQRGTEMRYFRAGQGTGAHAWPWTLLSMVVGWWGFPWGILFTFQTIYTNCMGGKDVTPELLGAIVGPQRATGIMAQAHKPQADMMLWLLRIFVLLIPLGIYAAIAGAEHTPR